MQELAVRRAYVLGISMGGVLAQQLALDHPELVERLILVNTFPYLRPDTFTGWLYYARRAVLVFTVGIYTQAKLVAQHLFPEPGQEPIREELIREISSADPRAYRGAMRALGLFDSRGRLGEIQAPTLVISGDRDTTVPLRNQQLLVKGISGCKHVILRGAGHAASVDKPDEFNRAVLDFLMDGH
jgi:pimeloyl-ACP methyl ester carboxylesterase